MKIAIGADHAGFEYKKAITEFLQEKGYEIMDFGTDSNEAVDYPDHAVLVAKAVNMEKADLGILICGTGIGMSIAANKVKGIRAALITSSFTAESSKTHNHANVITFGSRVNTIAEVLSFIEIFMKTKESNETRHQQRVDKIGKYEVENE
ncbi:MAG: ribose 5-phosphate isomerase B [Candidatus Izemoplasmatales bacterium]|nr:ribose 5-phosphate isomerase B [Candidatus Izemoplasmatales bacterium]MDY0139050.1 ribose 5-phosphate isomerase B [Candidatus Izemoplasmatales bacterium]